VPADAGSAETEGGTELGCGGGATLEQQFGEPVAGATIGAARGTGRPVLVEHHRVFHNTNVT
jgi:hypothetical protein